MNPYYDNMSHDELIAEIRKRQDLSGGDLVDNFHIEDGEYGEWSGLELLKAYAECLDKAHKREIEEIGAGNVAKLRETLHAIGNACAWIADNNATDPTGQTQRYLRDIVAKVKEALAAPARECDRFEHISQSHELHEAFVRHCDNCEKGCPMGCDHRMVVGKERIGATTPLGLMLDPQCGSILSCFAAFALSKAITEDKEDEKGKDN